MAKSADKYYKIDSWKIIEEGFNPEYGQVSESIFSLGNEYMGIRGFFEEGYLGESLIGSYFNGVYEKNKHQAKGYKGDVEVTEYMVNAVNWLYVRIIVDNEELNLNQCEFTDFKRELDLKTGILNRNFIWKTKTGKILKITFERALSMNQSEIGLQKITLKPLNFSGEMDLIFGLDFSIIHESVNENLWDCSGRKNKENYLSITGTTKNTKQRITSSCKISGDYQKRKYIEEDKKVSNSYQIKVTEGQESSYTRVVENIIRKEINVEDFSNNEILPTNSMVDTNKIQLNNTVDIDLPETDNIFNYDYEEILEKNKAWWENTWEMSDIVIVGDELNQQGIRYCIFQMFQTYHGAVAGTNIGAKGLTGEAYNGNAFWDTETYCLPFYIFNNMEAAKNLLKYRFVTLPEAKERANELDCEGAFYPVATISGKECCNLWQHASLQLQASTAVAYGIWLYDSMTEDKEFLFENGAEMLIEISRMLVSRGDYSADRKHFGFYGVMGPDEFQMMVNHNCYTNYMGRFTLKYTVEVLESLKEVDTDKYHFLADKVNLIQDELSLFKQIAEDMYIPYDQQSKLYEEQEGFFNLPHIDVDTIPREEFPLYNNWSYARIYRNDMIKQPDVLMLMLLFNSDFSEEEIRANYDYYEPRCIHESSLSPSVHSILASQLKKHSEAYDFFKFATRMDLDNYNRNSGEGLHITSIAAAWMNIVYGFGGMRSDIESIDKSSIDKSSIDKSYILSFCPSIPEAWEKYSFRITWDETVVLVIVTKENTVFSTIKGNPIEISVYGKLYTISNQELTVRIPEEWRVNNL